MIGLVVTRGYSNGTLTGTIADVTRRGYSSGAAVAAAPTFRGFLVNVGRLMR